MPSESTMRYGCNPNQSTARFYMRQGGQLPLEILNGAPSYINLMDALNAWPLVRELNQTLSLPAAHPLSTYRPPVPRFPCHSPRN